jgi:hypothetical protein
MSYADDIIKVGVGDNISLFYEEVVDVWSGYAWDEPIESELAGYPVNTIYTSDHGAGSYAGFIVTKEETIINNPSLVKNFIVASLKGWDYALENKEDAAKYAIERNPSLSYEHQLLAMGVLEDLTNYHGTRGCFNKDRLMGKEYLYYSGFVDDICPTEIYQPINIKNITFIFAILLGAVLVAISYMFIKITKKKRK